MITSTLSLPARLYLLSWDAERSKLIGNDHDRGMVARAAALTELLLAGNLTDTDGKPTVVPAAEAPADPVLALVLADLVDDKPRRWRTWISRRTRPVTRAVRDQLVANGWVRTEQLRILGVFPYTRVVVPDTRVVTELTQMLRTALSGGRPVSEVDVRDAALVALAAAGEVRPAMDRRRRREHKERIEQLEQRVRPVPTALRKALAGDRAAVAAAAGGGGG